MLVVADSSPLIALTEIGHLELLPALFGQVVIPPQIFAELSQSKRSQRVREVMSSRPDWLVVQAPATIESIPALHSGECAAISLARELKADLLLIDERLGRQAAAERQLRFTGTIGVLELGAKRRLLDLKDAFERLKSTDFWISPSLLDARLKLHESSEHG